MLISTRVPLLEAMLLMVSPKTRGVELVVASATNITAVTSNTWLTNSLKTSSIIDRLVSKLKVMTVGRVTSGLKSCGDSPIVRLSIGLPAMSCTAP